MNLASAGDAALSIGSVLLVILIIVVSFAAYWLPAIIAYGRRREIPNLGSVVVINGLLGWTLVGWAVALAMAVRSRPPYMPAHVPAAPPYVPPAPRQPPAPAPDPGTAGYR